MRQEKTTTMIRQWYILRLLRHVHYVSTQDIKESLLCHYSIDVDLRTIQRDLQGLMTIFPLECRDNSSPYGWRWQKEALHELPMSHSQALTFMMVETQLKDILPHTVLQELQPYFEASKAIVESKIVIPPVIAGVTAFSNFIWPSLLLRLFASPHQNKTMLQPKQQKQAFKALFTILDQQGLAEWRDELNKFISQKM